MNVETLADYVREFDEQLIHSGFRRDLQDYEQSVPQNQGNILALREIAENIRQALQRFEVNGLPNILSRLLPNKKVRPFTEKDWLQQVEALLADKEIKQDEFFRQLHQMTHNLNAQVQVNEGEIRKIADFISPYVGNDVERLTETGRALISIIFKDEKTIYSLKELTKTLNAWNRVLPIYHRLLKAAPPEDVSLVEVQNGSIDFVVNLDVDVAVNLAELFETAFKCYVAYLTYKKLIKPITDTFQGNQELIRLEEARETALLENIGKKVEHQILAQHKEAKTRGAPSDHTEIMVTQVSNLVTAHVVRGNDVKVLALPEASEETPQVEVKVGLRKASNEANAMRKELPPQEVQKLLELYGSIREESHPTPPHTKKSK